MFIYMYIYMFHSCVGLTNKKSERSECDCQHIVKIDWEKKNIEIYRLNRLKRMTEENSQHKEEENKSTNTRMQSVSNN
jgi:hypothetical protein